MQISLAQALKVKNKLVGEIASVKQLIMTKNSYKQGQKNNYDVKALFAELAGKLDTLVELKAKIFTANAGIATEINQMAEIKGLIETLKNTNTKEGRHFETPHSYAQAGKEEIYEAVFKDSDITELVKKYEVDVFNLQEKIDSYNHSTKIEIEL